MITRQTGLENPVALLKAECIQRPRHMTVAKGVLGNGLPQGTLTIGMHSTATRYTNSAGPKRPGAIAANRQTLAGAIKPFAEGVVHNLFIPVFAEKSEIMVEGVYVTCPDVFDISCAVTSLWESATLQRTDFSGRAHK